MFPSPLGDKFQHMQKYQNGMITAFPSPHGDKFQQLFLKILSLGVKFPSPHGDKFQRIFTTLTRKRLSFRPLTGINFNPDTRSPLRRRANSFRPLTGINFNAHKASAKKFAEFPSPHGDKFQRQSSICSLLVVRVSVPSRG